MNNQQAYARAFQHASAGMCLLAPEAPARVLAVNAALSEITGRSEADLLADGSQDLGLGDLAGQAPTVTERLIARGDGRPVRLRLEAATLPDGGTLIEIHDITAQRRAEQCLRAESALGRLLGRAVTVEGAIPALLPEIGPALESEVAIGWLLDSDAGMLRAHGIWCSPDCDAGEFARLSRTVGLAPGVDLPGRAWASRRLEWSADIGADAQSPRATAAVGAGFRRAMAVPLAAGSEHVGVIEVVSRSAGDPQDLKDVASSLGSTIAELLAPKSTADRPLRSNEVLLVEDNEFIAEVISETLRSQELNFQVDRCERLSEARERLLRGRPACVLLDLTLPDADGLQALIQLRELAPDVPIVILTGHEDERLAIQAMQEGAQDYLMKRRVDMCTLGRAIRYSMERERAQQGLLERALHDQISGLPNRALFLDRLRVALTRAQAGGGLVGVVLVNVDRFRLVNETLGRASGNIMLVEVAARLAACVARGTTIASVGPDEFAVLIEGAPNERDAIATAERMRVAIAEPFAIDGHEMHVTATAGAAFANDVCTAESLVRNADTALSRGKELGGDRLEVFDEGIRDRMRRRMLIESALRAAISREELRLHYQPIVSLADGAPVAIEALVRWQHPERGLLPPAEFISVAEETGLIVELGEWVLHEACTELVRLRRGGSARPDLQVNVNLSGRQLADLNLIARVKRAIDATGLPPAALCLEVTESSVIADIESSSLVLRRLRELGVTLALDDFGTGYSSLSYLQRLPMQVLKLDRSFVAALDNTERDMAIVAGIGGLAPRLGLVAVAEGVETEEQVDRLASFGYTLAQGFHFGRPVPADEIARHLSSAPVAANGGSAQWA